MERQHLNLGLLAHVDAGKTTLSEAILYQTGTRRTLGRVDHRDAFLDTHDLERQRGITIFSKQALFATEHWNITLVDTPGHADFSAEAERVMPILDCAVLIISATDGIQSHTLTLWNLLQRYHVPVFLFLNKTDLPGKTRQALMAELEQLGSGFVDFSQPWDAVCEAAAMCDEKLLEQYLQEGKMSDTALRTLVAQRKLFPCCFGSALKLEGIDTLLKLIDTYAPERQYENAFSARVYKISYDPQGTRLTWLKVTGGCLQPRMPITTTPETAEEKILQLRLYSGEKFTLADKIVPGQLCAATGLNHTYAGQGLGAAVGADAPVMEPVMTYRLLLPAGCDPMVFLPKLRLLEEEDPQLRIYWDASAGQIHAQIMGKIQLEVLKSLIAQRFSLDVDFDNGRICYKETISAPVEGVGHFEPLRHYAEVHILLEPLPPGSGLVFDTRCPSDVLDGNYQRLILSHLEEKQHLGVLLGAPITDMKLTLLVGKAHIKHTEGGDFRQATYRAVRQGLMQAESVVLEPWYDFTLTVPMQYIGRAITDIRGMGGNFDTPQTSGENTQLKGILPASELKDYADTLASYTQGLGRLQLALHGYLPCHDAEAVIAAAGYDPEADLENTPDSVFCDHGAGVTVKWNKITEYMHLDSGFQKDPPVAPAIITRNLHHDDRTLEEIMEREFGPIRRPQYRAPENRPARETLTIRPPRKTAIIVDGYNIIHSWDDLAETAKTDLEAARRQLCDSLSSFAGFRECYLVVVFDGYRVKGNPGEKQRYHNIEVVYTGENETADSYIEALVAQIGPNYAVRVATSDALVQISSWRSGVLRMSARELLDTVRQAQKEMRQYSE